MKTKLIKLSDQNYVVADNSEIKADDYYVGWETNYATEPKERWVLYNLSSTTNGTNPLKVTHSTQLDKGIENITFISLSEVEEAIYGYSVEKLALQNQEFWRNGGDYDTFELGYKEGFKAHRELVKDKLFTIEDMKKMFAMTLENAPTTESHTVMISDKQYRHHVMDTLFDRLILPFLPKTEWDIEFDEQGKIKLL